MTNEIKWIVMIQISLINLQALLVHQHEATQGLKTTADARGVYMVDDI